MEEWYAGFGYSFLPTEAPAAEQSSAEQTAAGTSNGSAEPNPLGGMRQILIQKTDELVKQNKGLKEIIDKIEEVCLMYMDPDEVALMKEELMDLLKYKQVPYW